MKIFSKLSTCILLFLAVSSSGGLKILGIFPTIGKSHFFTGEGIMKALHSAGHEVTVLSPFPQKKPMANWTDIDIPKLLEIGEERHKSMNFFEMKNMMFGPLTLVFLSTMLSNLTSFVLESPTLEPLYKKKMNFDLVICEIFNTEAFIGFAQHFDVPLIVMSSAGSNKWTNDLVGTPQPTSYVPNLLLSYTDNMSIWQRTSNFLMGIWEDFFMYIFHTPRQRSLYNKHFPNAKLTYDEALKNVSLAFVNTHISLSTPKPYAPNMIEIGGVNIERKIKPLPKDIADFISTATDGVIYFSLGSHIRSSQLPKSALSAIVSTFKKLKQKVLWKLDDPSIVKEKIPNLLISTWFPQNDILAHPKVVLFISHGGLLSTTESAYHGKPILGIPVLGDQELNIAKAVNLGWALRLDFNEINEQNFYDSINEILKNPKYTSNVQRISRVYKDQPMTPRESVVYWTEYVARHHGAPHLKSKVVDMCYIKKYNIDIIAYLVASIMITARLLQLLLIKLCRKKPDKVDKPKSSKKKTKTN